MYLCAGLVCVACAPNQVRGLLISVSLVFGCKINTFFGNVLVPKIKKWQIFFQLR
jgi:hypothetical protein